MDTSKIRFFGRHIKKDNYDYFSFSGCGFEFSVLPETYFYTVSLSMISELREHDAQYIAIFVNDVFHSKLKLLAGNNSYTFTLSEQRRTTIKVVKINETYISSIYLKDIVLNGARFDEAQTSNRKTIGFFGDSLTCGYGILEYKGISFKTETEDFTKAYPYLTAKALNMDYTVIARSGISISLPIYVDKLFNEIYDTVDMYEKCEPEQNLDYAVINLGTNDNAAYEQVCEDKEKALFNFKQDYISLILKIIKDSPNVKLLMCFNFVYIGEDIINAIKDIYRLIKDNTPNPIALVEFKPTCDGANGHPYYPAHEEASRILVDAIKSL